MPIDAAHTARPERLRLGMVGGGTGEAYIVDNNQATWNTTAHGVTVRAPQALQARDFDLVVIASVAGRQALSNQLDGMGLSYGSSYAFFLDTFSIGKVQVALTL